MNRNEINRRTLFKVLLAPALLSSGLVKATSLDMLIKPKNINGGLGQECLEVYKQWQQLEVVKPEVFFAESMKNYNLEFSQVSKATTLDFICGQLFEVNGLVLGKTEAAFIAYLGSQMS